MTDGTSPPAWAEPVEVARRFAALSASFKPRALRDVLADATKDVFLAVTADLESTCDTDVEGGGWLLRGGVRKREIAAWADAGELDEAVAWRRSFPTDAPTDDLLDALTGSGAYAETTIRDTVNVAARDVLNRVATALERAGEQAPAYESLDLVRAALGRDDSRARADAMLGRGFVGREQELADIAIWLASEPAPSRVRTVFITGLPGIGKSTLVDEAAHRASSATPPWIVVRLDFDRSGLDVQDRVGLTMEISRQVANEIGEQAADLRQARLVAAGTTPSSSPDVKGEAREHVPDELSRVLGDAVQNAGRPILMLIDTIEVLRGRGETHPIRLFECLDELQARRLSPMAVLSAGRGDALDPVAKRIGLHIKLTGLSDEASDQLLQSLDIAPTARRKISDLAEGNPLLLRLAAQVVHEAGVEALSQAQGRSEVAAAYLHRFLLSRIKDTVLQELAEPGLIVRRISPEVIAEVLAPALDLDLEPGEAVRLFDELASHHWLVEPDSVSGWVRHRSDIRAVLLRLLYDGGKKAIAARVDRAAADWFSRRPEPFAPIESAYHLLQAMRTRRKPPPIDPQLLAQFDKETIAQLPKSAQDLIRAGRGERTSQWRGLEQPLATADAAAVAGAASELETLVERGDLIEAAFVYERSLSKARLDSLSREAAVVRTFLWRTGRWAGATKNLASSGFFDSTDWARDAELSPLSTLVHLEIWAELRFRELVAKFVRDAELANLAAELRTRGIKGSLANGALGFAMFAAGAHRASSSWSLDDPVGAAIALWHVDPNATSNTVSPTAVDALAMPASRFAELVSPRRSKAEPDPTSAEPLQLPDVSTPAGAARVLASSTPYGSVAEALRMLGRQRFGGHLSSVDFDLAERGGLPPAGAGGWSIAPAVSPEGSIDNLAALGVLSEWLGAAAAVARDHNLRLISRSAERWRRTTSGNWSYARSALPAGSGWDTFPDATIADRIRQLIDSPDGPLAASADQMHLWWGSDYFGDSDSMERAARRYPAAVRDASRLPPGADPAQWAAEALLRRMVPAAFVPPLAVHIAFSTSTQEGS